MKRTIRLRACKKKKNHRSGDMHAIVHQMEIGGRGQLSVNANWR